MCFQVLFGFLSRPKTRPYRALCVLKNASKSRDISRETKRSRDARVLSVEPLRCLYFVCYFPPEGSPYSRDIDAFYAHLITQLYLPTRPT